MIKILLASVLTFSITTVGLSQAKSPAGHYLVEFDKVSPPSKDIITHLEGSEAKNFMAPDINGEQRALHKYKGQDVVLTFWDIEDPSSTELIGLLNAYQNENPTIKVLAFCNQDTKKAAAFVEPLGVKYPVLGHGAFIGEAHYYPTLGNPRMFLIGEDGIIKQVIPGEMLEDITKAKGYLDELSLKSFGK